MENAIKLLDVVLHMLMAAGFFLILVFMAVAYYRYRKEEDHREMNLELLESIEAARSDSGSSNNSADLGPPLITVLESFF